MLRTVSREETGRRDGRVALSIPFLCNQPLSAQLPTPPAPSVELPIASPQPRRRRPPIRFLEDLPALDDDIHPVDVEAPISRPRCLRHILNTPPPEISSSRAEATPRAFEQAEGGTSDQAMASTTTTLRSSRSQSPSSPPPGTAASGSTQLDNPPPSSRPPPIAPGGRSPARTRSDKTEAEHRRAMQIYENAIYRESGPNTGGPSMVCHRCVTARKARANKPAAEWPAADRHFPECRRINGACARCVATKSSCVTGQESEVRAKLKRLADAGQVRDHTWKKDVRAGKHGDVLTSQDVNMMWTPEELLDA